MFNKIDKNMRWVRAAVIRAVRTMAQTAAAAIGSAGVFGAVDWRITISSAGVAGILSMLTSLAGLPEVEKREEE